MRVGAGDNEEMEQLMTMPNEIKPPRKPPLGHPGGIHNGAEPVERAHERLIPRRHHGLLPPPPIEHELVRDGDEPGRAHGGEERGAERAERRRLERRRQRRGGGGDAEQGDGDDVERAERRVAEEGVVDDRVEGGDDERRDAGVVEAERQVRRPLRVAQEEVADAAG